MAEAPKFCLHAYYGDTRRRVITKDDYHSWHDSGPPHAMKWTSVFCCPLTGEVFPSCRYDDEMNYVVQVDEVTNQNVVWYHRKITAEHAAAARALDCSNFRETPAGEDADQIGDDPPYSAEMQLRLPSSAPATTREAVEALQARVGHRYYHFDDANDGNNYNEEVGGEGGEAVEEEDEDGSEEVDNIDSNEQADVAAGGLSDTGGEEREEEEEEEGDEDRSSVGDQSQYGDNNEGIALLGGVINFNDVGNVAFDVGVAAVNIANDGADGNNGNGTNEGHDEERIAPGNEDQFDDADE